MFKWLKALLFGIWGLLLIPPIGTTLEKWLGENVFSEPNGVAATISNNLAAVSQLRWFKFALVFMTGLVVGVSLESLNRKSGERKAFEIGRLLEDGHLEEASREALSWKPFLDREKPS